jgi:energy-converting hydrogenase Eha subunit G
VTASTALLIVYYAASGTLMIWLGRRRRVQALRVIGLLLTLLAAGKALIEAFAVPNVAVQIAIFVAVSAFLIAVGYWYRRGGDDAPTAEPIAV